MTGIKALLVRFEQVWTDVNGTSANYTYNKRKIHFKI